MANNTSDTTVYTVNGTNYSDSQLILAELRVISLLLAYQTDLRGGADILDNLRSEALGAI